MTCGRRVPYTVHGRQYYFTCDLPRGHDPATHPCSGRAHDYGAPRL